MSNLQCMSQSVGTASSLAGTFFQVLMATYCGISDPNMWPPDYGQEIKNNIVPPFDFIIVGAGSAGSVLGGRLSVNPSWNVLVIEAGGNPPVESEIPALVNTMRPSEFLYDYQTEPSNKYCMAFNNGSCNWPRGKMLGGSGGVNAMIYLRGNEGDFKKWKVNGWSYNDVLPYFEKSPEFIDDVGLHLNHFSSKHPLAELVLKSAEEMGQTFVEDYIETNTEAYTYVWANQKDGRRMSTAKTYLATVKDRPNLKVLKHAVVTKVNFERKVAKSVTVTYKDNEVFTIPATKEIIISAGTVDSPKLLLLSGIGPRSDLAKLKIPIIKSLPVGLNLQDHYSVHMFFKLNKTAIPEEDSIDQLYHYLRNGTGPLSGIATLSLVGMVNTDTKSGNSYPDIGLYHVPHANMNATLKDYGLDRSIAEPIMEADKDSIILEILVCLMRPESTGKVELRSKNPQDNVKINANYLSSKNDMDAAIRGVKYQASFVESPTFKAFDGQFVELNIPECKQYIFKSDDYWRCYVKYMGTTIYHPIGSNKMGNPKDKSAVVDPKLRVKGVKRLRVIDASIIPHMVSANVNAATIMIGEKGADMIIEDWGNYTSGNFDETVDFSEDFLF